jgi:hypothetical protein
MVFRRVRCRTSGVRRVTWRRIASVRASGIQTSGRKPLAESLASTVAPIVSVLMLASAITRTCWGLAITTRPTCAESTSTTAAALPVASTTT